MDKTCKTCKWWKPPEEHPDWSPYCQNKKIYNFILSDITLTCYRDAIFKTYDDFGCVLWEEKE